MPASRSARPRTRRQSTSTRPSDAAAYRRAALVPVGAIRMSDHLPLLAETPLFGSLDHDELVALSGRLELVSVEPGRTLFERGDPGGILYLVRRGRVRLFLEN